MQIMKG